MEVVLLLLGIVGIALVAVPRIQRRSSGGRRAARVRRAPVTKRKRSAAAAAAPAPVATWTPAPAPAAVDEDAWDDDLGWEGVDSAAPETREAWERWRETESPLAAEEPADAPVEPVAELPSVERWRAQAQEEDEWLDEDDGLGWEGASDGPAPWRDSEPDHGAGEPARNGNGHHAEPSDWTPGRDWTRTGESVPAEPAVASTWTRTDESAPAEPAVASASAATDVAPSPEPALGRTYALEEDDWTDEPAPRPWGAPAEGEAPAAAPIPARRGKRKLHPVVLLAIYAAAGIGLVVMASTVLLGGSADAPAEPRPTPEPTRTAEPTPEATGSVADDPAALEAARAAEAAARSEFRRERTRALAASAAAVDRAQAAARKRARAAERAADRRREKQRQARNNNPGGSGQPPTNNLAPPTTYTPPPSGGGGGGTQQQRRPDPVCEFCIG